MEAMGFYSEEPSSEEKTHHQDDNCFGKCLKCLGSVPGPSLTACVMMVVAVSASAASFMIGASRSRTLLNDDKLLPHTDTIGLSVIFGMLFFGIIFVIVAVMSSGTNAKHLFNSRGKNICARVLNAFTLILVYILLMAWMIVSSVVVLPIVLFGIIHILHMDYNVKCINLQDYAIYSKEHKICDAELELFYEEGQDVFLCFVISYVASLLVVFSMILFIMCTSANYLYLSGGKSGGSVYKNHDNRTSNNSVHDTRM